MKRTVYTAIFTAVVSVAAGHAMADTVKTTDAAKPVHHKRHHAEMAHQYGWSEKEVQGLQQSLRDSGFYKGTVTGRWSPMTENALASYQNANGLTVTGTLNDATVKQLGLHHMAEEKVSGTETPMPKHKKHHWAHKAEHKEVTAKEEKAETKTSH